MSQTLRFMSYRPLFTVRKHYVFFRAAFFRRKPTGQRFS